MKKRLIVATVAALCAFSGVAEAEPGTVAEVSIAPSAAPAVDTPAPFTESDVPYDGNWLPFEDGFRLYLPRGWAAMELTGAQRDAGLFYRAGSGDGAMGIAVGYMSASGLGTLEQLAGDFEKAGYTGVVQGDLNGIPAIAFERAQEGYRGVAFFHPVYPEYALYVYVSPLAPLDEAAGQIGAALLASISPLPAARDMLKKY